MRRSYAGRLWRGLPLFALLLKPGLGAAGPARTQQGLGLETGAGKSYVIPAAELLAFIGALNLFNRTLIDPDEYGTDGHSIWENLKSGTVIDKDPFSVNQIGHPYQG